MRALSQRVFKLIMKSEKALTLEDLAATLGMSRASVSRAFTGKGRISPQTREKVLQSARELGYQPNPHAQRLAGARALNTVGLFSLGLDYGVTTEKIKIIQQLLPEQGFHVPLYAYSSYNSVTAVKQVEMMSSLRQQQPRAIICATRGLEPDALEQLKLYHDEGGIVVCYDYSVELDCDQVVFDREDNNYRATRHLVELGHKDIGLYMEGDIKPDAQSPITGSRVRGFERALQENNLSVNADWMFCGLDVEEGGALLAKQFLALQHRPTAMCIVNDRATATFVNEIQHAGPQVPADVSIVCHDDQPVARFCAVPLSAAIHPSQQIAECVVEMLSSRFDGSYEGDARQHGISGAFIQRASTAPIHTRKHQQDASFSDTKANRDAQTLTTLTS